MIYTFVMLDRPHVSKLRLEVRPEHKAYLGMQAERIAFAGPLVDDEGNYMHGSLLAIDFPNRDVAMAWLRDEPFNKAGLYASVQIHASVNLWPQKAGFAPAMNDHTIKHIVMWNVRGDTPEEKRSAALFLKEQFEGLKGRIPGLQRIEVGLDTSGVDYACDVVLYTEFDTQEALDAYATHPEHLRVKGELGDMRIARHQVDYPLSQCQVEVATAEQRQ